MTAPAARLVPQADASAPTAGRDLAVALAFAVASCALFLVFGQGILYGDGAEFMLLLREGAAGHKNHLAYIPLLRASAALGDALGLAPFVSARLLSQAGAALGVGVFYLVARRFGLTRRDAAWVTALIASTPSVIFFATVVEVHAPYFAFLAVAWLAAAHLARAPSAARGACLGVACGAAYLGHASGLVLPAPLLLVVWHATGNARALLRPALACALAHLLVVTLVPWLLSGAGHVASPAGAARFMAWWKMDVFAQPAAALLVLWDEWLLAYAPISLLWLRAFATARATAWVALAALLPYLALSIALLAVYREFGAYQHAVVWLFAWLVVRTWGVPARVLAIVAGIVIAGWKVHASDQRARVAAYAAGLTEITGNAEPLLLVGGLADYEHCFIAAPHTACENLASVSYAEPSSVADALRRLDRRIAEHRARGGRVFLTAGGYELISTTAARAPASGFATLLQHLLARYRREIVGATPRFVGAELLPLE